jgi:hypothetical protein
VKRLLRKLGLAAALSAAANLASPPTIGVASALGPFSVDNAEVQGNANLFEGTQLKTGKASGRVFMQNGASLVLGIDSIATIYRDHLVLQQGATKVDNMTGFAVYVGDYRIASGQAGSQVVVRVLAGSVEIAAFAGSLNVFNSRGILLTRIGAGTASAFETSGGAGGGPGGNARRNNNNLTRRDTALFLMIAGALAALGLIFETAFQQQPTSR